MDAMTATAVALGAGLLAAAALVVAVVLAAGLPWWAGILALPVLDGALLLWAWLRLRAIRRERASC